LHANHFCGQQHLPATHCHAHRFPSFCLAAINAIVDFVHFVALRVKSDLDAAAAAADTAAAAATLLLLLLLHAAAAFADRASGEFSPFSIS